MDLVTLKSKWKKLVLRCEGAKRSRCWQRQPAVVGNTDHQAPQNHEWGRQNEENRPSQSSGDQGSIWAWFPRRLLSSPGRLVEPGFRSFLRQSENRKKRSLNSEEKRMDTATDELGERADIYSTWSDRVEDQFKKKYKERWRHILRHFGIPS